MAVNPILSSGFKLEVDIDGLTAFVYEPINAVVDIDVTQRAPRQEKTRQLTNAGSRGVREFLAGLREKALNFSLRWDAADATASTVTHKELYEYGLAKRKMAWRLTYPPIGATNGIVQVQPLTYTGARRRAFLAVITSLVIHGQLGTVITADVSLAICGAITTEDTVP